MELILVDELSHATQLGSYGYGDGYGDGDGDGYGDGDGDGYGDGYGNGGNQ